MNNTKKDFFAFLVVENLRRKRITYISWCFMCKHSYLTTLTGSITSIMEAFKMVKDTMNYIGYYKGCTIQLGLLRMEEQMPGVRCFPISIYVDRM